MGAIAYAQAYVCSFYPTNNSLPLFCALLLSRSHSSFYYVLQSNTTTHTHTHTCVHLIVDAFRCIVFGDSAKETLWDNSNNNKTLVLYLLTHTNSLCIFLIIVIIIIFNIAILVVAVVVFCCSQSKQVKAKSIDRSKDTAKVQTKPTKEINQNTYKRKTKEI